MLEKYTFNSVDQIKAYGNSLRLRLIHLLIEKPYTGSQLARILKIPRQKTHYHLNVLKETGLITIEKEGEVKGLKEYYYRAIARSYFVPDDFTRSEQMREFLKSNEGAVSMAHLNLVRSDIQNYISSQHSVSLYSVQETSFLTSEQILEVREELRRISRKIRDYGDKNLEENTSAILPTRLTITHIPLPVERDEEDLFDGDESLD